jgi:hypothetical protein
MDPKNKKKGKQLNAPPRTIEEARQRVREDVQPLVDTIIKYGEVPDIRIDGFTGWRREAMRSALHRARKPD